MVAFGGPSASASLVIICGERRGVVHPAWPSRSLRAAECQPEVVPIELSVARLVLMIRRRGKPRHAFITTRLADEPDPPGRGGGPRAAMDLLMSDARKLKPLRRSTWIYRALTPQICAEAISWSPPARDGRHRSLLPYAALPAEPITAQFLLGAGAEKTLGC